MTRHDLVRAAWVAGSLLLGACGEPHEAQQPPPPPTVGVARAAWADVTAERTYNGRVEAVDVVELRARVEGFVEKRPFEEGSEVKAGDLLIVLEKGPYRARVGEVQGQITAAEGTLRLARIERERQENLVRRDVAAQAALDKARGTYEQALGELQRLKAALERAQLDLGYTDIHAPIDGRIGTFAFSVGDFVGPSSGPLAVIVRQDPMHVTFPVSARVVREVRRDAAARGRDPRAVKVRLRLPDGTIYRETGVIDFVGVQVDPATDTVTIRATVPNVPDGGSERALFHEQLVGVIIEETDPQRALLIPQAAVAVDQGGPYVLAVNEQGTVEQRGIRPGAQHGTDVVVLEGLQEGEQVVVDGLQKVRPGQTVTVRPPAGRGDEP